MTICHPAKLILSDGTEFHGTSLGYHANTTGEICFNTGMVGYTESLTDPSYCGQILVFTYPLLGSYGVSRDDSELNQQQVLDLLGYESSNIQVRAMICSSFAKSSHHSSRRDLTDWLTFNKIPGLCDIDTRQLTKHIRNYGAQMGKIVVEKPFEILNSDMTDINLENLVARVSNPEYREYYNYTSGVADPSKPIVHLVAVDCGMKLNILRILLNTDIELCQLKVTVVPWDYKFSKLNFDGLFLSNGPGDPEMIPELVEEVKIVMDTLKPIFGICLGHQILALAGGATTSKMKFGHRGMNHPVMDMRTSRTYISSQNHGFTVDTESLPEEWIPFFTNVNDGSNEGIIHVSKPWSSVQFHPEGSAGPNDTSYLFKDFLRRCAEPNYQRAYTIPFLMPEGPKKVLVLGSGGLSIGQAGEFDYSGSQCLKALKENNITSILINSNIATVQTSPGMADKTYFLPTTKDFVTKVIKKERPNGLLCTFGGQTALNCAVELYKAGILKKYNVQVLGTPIETIMATEDRQIFSQKLAEIGERCATSITASTLDEAVEGARIIGYPVLVRSAYTLGGLGSGFCENVSELKALCEDAFQLSPQVIVDQSLRGWKEIEYEVVRDKKANCIAVCNMENFDPLGIHTGDSIVVAPSQTLTNTEYYLLRDVSLRVIDHLKVVGECNIQFALNPSSDEYVIVEVNARLSRSSALASKATGYPLAYVAANIALGHDLPSLRNKVTLTTTACFEPSLDYIVTKIPRWDLNKFGNVPMGLGSAMKSVGEVMAIGRSWKESLQKALRMVSDNQRLGFETSKEFMELYSDKESIEAELKQPSCDRIWLLPLAFERGCTVDDIHKLTMIDKWFLYNLYDIHLNRKEIKQLGGLENLTFKVMMKYKQAGFGDKEIASLVDSTEADVRDYRVRILGITPCIKEIDTVAGEHPAQTNYLYLSYHGDTHDVCGLMKNPASSTISSSSSDHLPHREDTFCESDPAVIVLGCGCYRIGSSVEFDWCSMSAVQTLRGSLNHTAIVINCNPETVSTDYDESDRLYFEDSGNLETVLDICEFEKPKGVIVSVGGQTPNNIAVKLDKYSIPIIGTSASSIDCAEDRGRFSKLCDVLGLDQPEWQSFGELQVAYDFCNRVGFPVLVRPSYVLSGAAMQVVYEKKDLAHFLSNATVISPDHPVVISKYIDGAKEVEMDAVADRGRIVIHAISEHVENAGVHSGDASLILPPQKLYTETITRVRRMSQKIAMSLNITGPFNIQYICRHNDVKVIECNLRASRTFPFISKTFNRNFIEIATKAMLGLSYPKISLNIVDIDYVGVKAPVFSFTRLRGADPRLGVEMRSTGEVACFGYNKHEAFLKSWVASNQNNKIFDKLKCILLSIGPGVAKQEMMDWIRMLVEMDVMTYCTSKTYSHVSMHDDPLIRGRFSNLFELCTKSDEDRVPNRHSATELIELNKVCVVINIPGVDKSLNENTTTSTQEQNVPTAGYKMRRLAADKGIPLLTDIKSTTMFVEAMHRKFCREKAGKEFWDIRSWNEIVLSLNISPPGLLSHRPLPTDNKSYTKHNVSLEDRSNYPYDYSIVISE